MYGHDPATDFLWYPDDYPGEAAAAAAAGDDEFLDIEGLLGLAWEGAALEPPHASPAGLPPSEDVRSCSEGLLGLAWEGAALEPPHASPAGLPPSEDMMAAWLYPIVSGEDNAGDGPMLKSEPSTMAMGMMESKGKLPATDDMYDVKEQVVSSLRYTQRYRKRRKEASGGSNRSRSSRHSDTHNVTEKRRRCKISDRLRTLQQLVPGCEKSNQASTLELTIQYMKSLQQQVQDMKVTPAQAVYPVMQTALAPAVAAPGTVAAGGGVPLLPAGMAPFGALLPCPHYHAVMVPAPEYRPQPVASAAAPEGQGSVSTEQRCNKERRRRRRL